MSYDYMTVKKSMSTTTTITVYWERGLTEHSLIVVVLKLYVERLV